MKNKIPWNLIISKLRQELSPEEEKSFQDWLVIDDNQQLFQQLEIVWQNVQDKIETYEPDLEYYWKELSARIDRSNNEKAKDNQPPRKPRNIQLKRIYKVAASIAAVVFIGIGIYYFSDRDKTGGNVMQTYLAVTEKSKIILPDSSEVWLHANSTITYNKSLNAGVREVDVIGEAYFKVKHDDKKPFLVNANGVVIKVHGTEFNVRSSEVADKVLVSLVKGSISMCVDDKDFILKPGEEGTFDKKDKTVSVVKSDIDLAKVWSDNKMRFENENLKNVCKYLSKWYGVDIQIDNTITENYSYTFTVKDQSLKEIIEIMSQINPFNYHFKGETELVLTRK